MNNHLRKAVQQSREDEELLDVVEFSPNAYEGKQLLDGTRLVDLFPDGMIAIFNGAGNPVVIESATNAKKEVFFGKGIEECIETQRAFNLIPERWR